MIKLSAAYFSELSRLANVLKDLRKNKKNQDENIDIATNTFIALISEKFLFHWTQEVRGKLQDSFTKDWGLVVKKLKHISECIFEDQEDFAHEFKEDFSIKNNQIKVTKLSKKNTNKYIDLPSGIRKPISSFFLFWMEQREKIKKTSGVINEPEITKILSKEWNILTSQQKKKYEAESKAMREKYKKHLESIKVKGQEENEGIEHHIYATEQPTLDNHEDSRIEVNRRILKSMLKKPCMFMAEWKSDLNDNGMLQVKIEDY